LNLNLKHFNTVSTQFINNKEGSLARGNFFYRAVELTINQLSWKEGVEWSRVKPL
jgi:hypothetical protein